MASRKAQNPITALWMRVPAYLRNRYAVTLLLFLLLMVFFDRHDVGTQFRLHRTVNRLEADLERYGRLTAEAEAERLDMEQNRERFARENYYMQQDDEDVFIIVDK
ncbi:cell division protein FtsB [Lewinella marina]|uniref:Septum formation initiator n=1 Tax=Neolewinella marina TaxID=438751 RepID=A0A2G0CE76_9BACT|nr:hypothetical protein [Neolewinella marina]NJB87418.1 cell division protein FtsB [Neolewinella marina]PHK98272.1 hypothetical protein CGL56_11250 [Neolewinella marina]